MGPDNPIGGGGRRLGGLGGVANSMSTDALLAAIEMRLASHGQMIEKVVDKVEDIDKSVTEMKTTMGHLVTKEACAEGRRCLSDDLTARMDGDREITGMNITLPKLLQKYAQNEIPTPVPSRVKPSTHPSAPPRERKSAIYYIKAISAIVSLTFAVITMTFFVYKIIDQMDQQQQMIQQIERNMARSEAVREGLRHVASPSTPGLSPNPVDGP
jgi:uncharacterized protein YoxC